MFLNTFERAGYDVSAAHGNLMLGCILLAQQARKAFYEKKQQADNEVRVERESSKPAR